MAPDTQMKRHEAQPPVAIARAQGPRLCDTDGRRYLDGISSWWVNLFGHNPPMSSPHWPSSWSHSTMGCSPAFTHAPVVQLSKRLGALTGLGHAFYGSDGAAATEIGLKMSAHHWRNIGRPTNTPLSVGRAVTTVSPWARWPWPDIALFRAAYAPLVRLAVTMPRPDARGAGARWDTATGRRMWGSCSKHCMVWHAAPQGRGSRHPGATTTGQNLSTINGICLWTALFICTSHALIDGGGCSRCGESGYTGNRISHWDMRSGR